MKRRHFFQLIAGAAMIPVLPRLAKAAPMIWADGIHCDSAGVQAMIEGLPVEFADPSLAAKVRWGGNVLNFGGVQFMLKEPVKIGTTFDGKTFTMGDFVMDLDGPGLIVENDVKDVLLSYCIFRGKPAPSTYYGDTWDTTISHSGWAVTGATA